MKMPGPPLRPLKEIDLQSSHVYGPVDSRRLGKSLGINPLPLSEKVCTFDCLYCQYELEVPVAGRGSVRSSLFPSESIILSELEEAAKRYRGEVDFLTFSGNGEPTLHPDFNHLVVETVGIRDRYLPAAGVALLSNGTTICDPEIRQAIEQLDKTIVKLDAGDEKLWREINRPGTGMHLEEIVSALAGMEKITMQSLFFDVEGTEAEGNISSEDIGCWLERMERIHPIEVQIYTLDRTPAVPGLRRAPREVLEEIQASLEEKGITGCVY